jgi:hypothetical protein
MTRWKWACFRSGATVIAEAPVRPITGRHSLFPTSSARFAISRPYGRPCPHQLYAALGDETGLPFSDLTTFERVSACYAGSLRCRVRASRCRDTLPSEPDVRVAPHPAQAIGKPCVSRAGGRGVQTPSSPGRYRPASDEPRAWWGDAAEVAHVRGTFICSFFLDESVEFHLVPFVRLSRSPITRWKWACFRSGATASGLLSARLQGGIRFFQRPLPAVPSVDLAVSLALPASREVSKATQRVYPFPIQ